MIDAIYQFDWSVFAWVRDTLWNPVLDVIMKYITLLGEGGVVWIILAVILLCTKKYRKCGEQKRKSPVFHFPPERRQASNPSIKSAEDGCQTFLRIVSKFVENHVE